MRIDELLKKMKKYFDYPIDMYGTLQYNRIKKTN